MAHIESLYHPSRDIELGYSIINIVLSRLTKNPQVLIAVISILITTLHIKFIEKNSKDPLLSVLLYFGLNFFLTAMVSWRQFIAMGIVFWIYPLMLKRKYVKAFFVLVASMLFHDTAIIFAVALLAAFLFSKYSKGSLWILIIGLIIIPFINIPLQWILKIMPAYQIYFTTIPSTNGVGKLRWVYIIAETIIVLAVAYRLSKGRKIDIKNNTEGDKRATPKNQNGRNVNSVHSSEVIAKRKRIAILATIMAYAVLCGLLAKYIPYMFRLGYYFDFFLLLLVPELLPQGSGSATMYKVLIAGMCIVLFVYYLSVNAGQTVPYKFFF